MMSSGICLFPPQYFWENVLWAYLSDGVWNETVNKLPEIEMKTKYNMYR